MLRVRRSRAAESFSCAGAVAKPNSTQCRYKALSCMVNLAAIYPEAAHFTQLNFIRCLHALRSLPQIDMIINHFLHNIASVPKQAELLRRCNMITAPALDSIAVRGSSGSGGGKTNARSNEFDHGAHDDETHGRGGEGCSGQGADYAVRGSSYCAHTVDQHVREVPGPAERCCDKAMQHG